ncbi:ABC transporter family substrate-binding protein [Actinocrispum wychmicini]|uniref:ABC-type transport system substrate-binding protein n=1 Tax=Actinocrispum wychmicini TaxID=1213861 RepID=A0A4R2JII6_9PSEU|nr:ABC transporter family substrate-binding protein [Actinocrispum wychmicini]TCO58567.1 ABC-type transport system substrate-binding protein [Actinocrispum wychmicini]
MRIVIAVVLGLALVAGCTNTPPPPVVGTVIPSAAPVKADEVVVGVDSVVGGYNPHVLADQSTVTTALSTMLLPSVFRPAPDGTPELDRTVMVSAAVTKSEPYTVTYRIRTDAAWSDASPVAAEDFVYLRERMRDEPGTLDSAGYRLISDIKNEEGGKVVQVTFAQPYPGWRSLFDSLLPAHILKDAPGGWDQALESGFPATAGPFSIKTMDMSRGDIVLERNERYWAKPAVVGSVILRRTDPPGLVEALRTGHDSLVVARMDQAGVSQLTALGSKVTVQAARRPTVLTILLRPTGPDLADERVRQALVKMLDRDALLKAGTGGGAAADAKADSLTLAPSQPGYAPTGPPGHDSLAAQQTLTQAGYSLVGSVWTREGRPLSVTLGTPADKEPYLSVAKEVERQLTAGGVQVKLVTPPAHQLLKPGSDATILVVPQPVGPDPAATLASTFSCPAAKSPNSSVVPPANLLGFCDRTLQPTIDAALTGSKSLSGAITILEPQLLSQSVAVPVFQLADSVAVRSELSVEQPTAPLNAPFATAATWQRNPK